MNSELAKHKVKCMTQEEIRWEKEYQERSRTTKFDEWERIQANIRTLREDLRDRPLMEPEERMELKADLESLKRRKLEVAVELGLVEKKGED